MNKSRVGIAILLSTIWISLSEFTRNELLFKSYWVDHYAEMELIFPSAPINGAVWGLWSLCFAIAIYIISRKFDLVQTTFLSWFTAFVLMWIAVGNLAVLPFKILYFAIPLSILEAFVASYIIFKFSKNTSK